VRRLQDVLPSHRPAYALYEDAVGERPPGIGDYEQKMMAKAKTPPLSEGRCRVATEGSEIINEENKII
jgi:hypothetical protein